MNIRKSLACAVSILGFAVLAPQAFAYEQDVRTLANDILNSGSNRVLELQGRTRLFDDLGNEYPASKGVVADASDSLVQNYYKVSKTLLYDVPVMAHLTFEGVTPQTTSITSLQIRGQIGNEDFRIDFQGVSLEAKKVSPIGPIAGGGVGGGVVREGVGTLKEEAGDALRLKFKKWKDKVLKEGDSKRR